MKKFEYTYTYSSVPEIDWERAGEKGWELVCVSNEYKIFKREVEPEAKIRGPLIEQVLFDFRRGKLVLPEKKDEERFVNFLCYCKQQGVEYLLDCRQYAMARNIFFCDSIHSVLECYEWEAKQEHLNFVNQ